MQSRVSSSMGKVARIALSMALVLGTMVSLPTTALAEDDQSTPWTSASSRVDGLSVDSDAGLTLRTLGGATGITSVSGDSASSTSAKTSLYTFDKSEYAVIVSSQSYADALSAAGLAGSLDCPILMTSSATLDQSTSDALHTLGVTKIILIGGQGSISADVEDALSDEYGEAYVTRISGGDRYSTQIAIYHFGVNRKLWQSDTAFVVSGTNFADALSVAPLAYRLKAPIFTTDETGALPSSEQQALISDERIKKAVLAGGTSAVSDKTKGAFQALVMKNGGSRTDVTRVSGNTRYATSLAIAQWAVANAGFSWDNAAFVSGDEPYDALAACAMQARNSSVLLLANGSDISAASGAESMRIGTGIRFIGGYASLSLDTRSAICDALSIHVSQSTQVIYTNYAISLAKLAKIEDDEDSYDYCTEQQFYDALNPATYSFGDDGFYQFAVLNQGYSGAVTAAQLDAYIDMRASSVEASGGYAAGGASNGVYSTMRGMGAAFIEAAKTYDVNEVYLMCIAGLESAWGCSTLAQGQELDGTTYYNLFGIGAYDSGANRFGLERAAAEGWSSPTLAVLGGGKWISENYLNNSLGPQNTFYKMKWDLYHAVRLGSVSHQYCTGCWWQVSNAKNMAAIYSYLGISMEESGLTFDIPVYEAD